MWGKRNKTDHGLPGAGAEGAAAKRIWSISAAAVLLVFVLQAGLCALALSAPGRRPALLSGGLLLSSALAGAAFFLCLAGRRSARGCGDDARLCRALGEQLPVGYALIRPVTGPGGGMTGYCVERHNPLFRRLYEPERSAGAGHTRDPYLALYGRVLRDGVPLSTRMPSGQSREGAQLRAVRVPGRRLALFVYGCGPDAPGRSEGELDRRISERTKELQDANFELESLNFTITHEIKAPIRAIDGYARIFLEDYGGALDEDARSMVGNIRSICRETIELVNRLLEYTRIAREEPGKEIVDLEQTIRGVYAEMSAAYSHGQKSTLRFESQIPPVIGDRILMRQAVTNILSNALKFTRDKPLAVITAGYREENGESIFYIRDNGAGFDMQFSEKLFGVFQRMHTSDEFEGSGIGLAIVKKIIGKHGGRVWITGEVGQGATVYFTLKPENVLKD